MERILSELFPPELPALLEREVITDTHIHQPFEHVPESGIGEVRERLYRDGIDRVTTEAAFEDIT